MTTLISFIVVLGILVIVHEYGHFKAARMAGVRVEVFSIGFGPRITSFQRGDTEYRIALIPLGGFVKMAGDDVQDTEAAAAPDAFYAKSVPARAGIVLAGPVMNLLLAFLLAPVVYLIGVQEAAHWDDPAVIGWIEGEAAIGSLTPGAQIQRVGTDETPTWRSLQTALSLQKGRLPVEFLTAEGAVSTTTIEQPEPGALLAVLMPPMEAAIDRVVDGGAAASAGIEPGDILMSIGDRPISHWLEIRSALDAAAGRPVTVEVVRDGALLALQLTPQRDPAGDRWLLGVARRELSVERRYGPIEAVKLGTRRVVEMMGLTLRVIRDLFTGRLGVDALGGPVMIAQGAGDAARAGVGAFLTFMIFISVQLGMLNLLPIPVLDGGHLVLLGFEAVFRRRMPERVIAALQWTGFVLLIGLMLYVTRNDIMRMWGTTIRRWLGG
jgi:regulator of sigma E protease